MEKNNLQEAFSNKKHIVIFIVSLLVLGIITFFATKYIKEYNQQIHLLKNENKNFEQEIKSLSIQNKKLLKATIVYDGKIDSLNNILSQIPIQKLKLKINYEKNIKSIDSYTDSEIERYFSNRANKDSR